MRSAVQIGATALSASRCIFACVIGMPCRIGIAPDDAVERYIFLKNRTDATDADEPRRGPRYNAE